MQSRKLIKTRTNSQILEDQQIGDWRNILSAEERIATEAKIRRLDEGEALIYCRARGFEMKRTKYYDLLKSVRAKTKKRVFALMKWKLEEQHLERIDELETIEHNLWKDYNSETDFKKRSDILINIARLQPLLSIYFKDLAIVSEKQLELEMKQIHQTSETKALVLKKTNSKENNHK